jgi:hypothetical protein
MEPRQLKTVPADMHIGESNVWLHLQIDVTGETPVESTKSAPGSWRLTPGIIGIASHLQKTSEQMRCVMTQRNKILYTFSSKKGEQAKLGDAAYATTRRYLWSTTVLEGNIMLHRKSKILTQKSEPINLLIDAYSGSEGIYLMLKKDALFCSTMHRLILSKKDGPQVKWICYL